MNYHHLDSQTFLKQVLYLETMISIFLTLVALRQSGWFSSVVALKTLYEKVIVTSRWFVFAAIQIAH